MKTYFTFKNLLVLFFFILVWLITITLSPKLLAYWESLYYFHAYGSLDNYLNFQISPRANIADTGHGFIDLSRSLLDFFNADYTLQNSRILSNIYALFFLIVFFFIVKKNSNCFIALIGTFFLSSSSFYIFYSNTMPILFLSILGLSILILSLIYIEKELDSKFGWFLFILGLIIISLHYGVGRIIGLLIIINFFLKIIFLNYKNKKKLKFTLKKISKNFIFSLIIFIFILGILNLKNLYYILNLKNFFLPENAEGFFMPLYKDYSSNILITLKVNLGIIFNSISGNIFNNENFNESYQSLLLNYRHPIGNIGLFISILAGLIIFFYKVIILKNFKLQIANSFIILIIVISILSLSLVFNENNSFYTKNYSSLSDFRIFFLILPLHLILSDVLNYLLVDKKKFIQSIVVFFIFGFIFNNYLNAYNQNYKIKKEIREKTYETNFSQFENNFSSKKKNIHQDYSLYLRQHLKYLTLSNKIKEVCNQLGKEKICLIQIDSQSINENLIVTKGLPYLNNYNYHSVYLNLYLNNLGLLNNWVQVVYEGDNNQLLGLSFGINRLFSAKTYLNKDGKLDFKKNNNKTLKYIIRGSNKSKKIFPIIISTSNYELNFVINFLKKNNKKFYLYKI